MPCSRRFFSGSEQRGGCGLFTVLALAGILLLAAPAFAETEQKPVFHSTFMQLWERHDAWTPSQWDRLCADLAELGVQEIILQWSLLTEPAFYWRLTPDRRAEVPQDRVEPAPAVDLIAQAAQRHGLRILFGLSEDSAWWQEIKNNADLVDVFLNRLLQDQLALAQTLIERYGERDLFAGFYIPQEIDDTAWIDAQRRAGLKRHMARLGHGLHELRPGVEIAVSCFATGRDDPTGFARLLADLVLAGNLSRILYQDGQGTRALRSWETEFYLQALATEVGKGLARVQTVVETFTLDSENQAFAPGPMDRIATQLRRAYVLTAEKIVAFSIPDYMHPTSGAAAAGLYQEYREYAGRAPR